MLIILGQTDLTLKAEGIRCFCTTAILKGYMYISVVIMALDCPTYITFIDYRETQSTKQLTCPSGDVPVLYEYKKGYHMKVI